MDEIRYDGRWFRDCFSGPYWNTMCTPKIVGNELYDEYAGLLRYKDGGDGNDSSDSGFET